MELDPVFLKALRLLHSKAKDSADQLHQMLMDVLAQKHTVSTIKESKLHYTSVKQESDGIVKLTSHVRKSSPKHISDIFNTGKIPAEDGRKRETDKRHTDKLKQDPDLTFETKKPRLDSPQPFHYSTPSPEPMKTEESGYQKTEEDTDSSEGNADADDFAMEMGLACIVCKQIDVTSGNQLIECQECHSLYHQECHRPPATDYDVNDPRRVWYCARCTKNMKKMASKTQKSSKSNNSSSKEAASTNRNRSHDNPPILLPFKRAEVKTPVTQGGGHVPTNKPIGLAGLAANFSGRTTTSASTSSASKTGSLVKTTAVSTSSSVTKPFSSFPSLMALSPNKTTTTTVTSSKITSTGSGLSGLASLVATSTTKMSLTASTSSSLSKSGSGLLSSTSSSSGRSSTSSGNNGNTNTTSGGAKPVSSSSLMSADKRLQIMKKKAAAKMQEKRRLSTK